MIFTTFGYNDIDNNPRATTCRSSFYGTYISLLQFHESPNQRGQESDTHTVMNPGVMEKYSIAHLPVSYTKDKVDIPPLPVDSPLRFETRPQAETLKHVREWLTHVHGLLEDGVVDSGTTKWISWAAY